MSLKSKFYLFLQKFANSSISKPALYIRLSGIMVGLIALILLAQYWNAGQPVKKLSVSGNSFIPVYEIQAAIKDSILDHPKNTLNIEQLRQQINSHPFIESAYISEGLQSLNIEVIERFPVAIVLDEYGELHYCDKEANLLPYRLFRQFTGLPIISGVFDHGDLDSASIRGAISILRDAADGETKTAYNLISEISYNKDTKEYCLFTSDNSTKVILGNADNMKDKLDKVISFWQNKAGKSDFSTIDYLDLRWFGQVILKHKSVLAMNNNIINQ